MMKGKLSVVSNVINQISDNIVYSILHQPPFIPA